MGKRRIFKSSQEYTTRPGSKQYTHVRRLCWPKIRDAESQASASDSSQANTGDEGPQPEASQDFQAWGADPQRAHQLATEPSLPGATRNVAGLEGALEQRGRLGRERFPDIFSIDIFSPFSRYFST